MVFYGKILNCPTLLTSYCSHPSPPPPSNINPWMVSRGTVCVGASNLRATALATGGSVGKPPHTFAWKPRNARLKFLYVLKKNVF